MLPHPAKNLLEEKEENNHKKDKKSSKKTANKAKPEPKIDLVEPNSVAKEIISQTSNLREKFTALL